MCGGYRRCEGGGADGLSQAPHPYGGDLGNFSFGLHRYCLGVGLSLCLGGGASVACSRGFGVRFLPLPGLPVCSGRLTCRGGLFSVLLPGGWCPLLGAIFVVCRVRVRFPGYATGMDILSTHTGHQRVFHTFCGVILRFGDAICACGRFVIRQRCAFRWGAGRQDTRALQ